MDTLIGMSTETIDSLVVSDLKKLIKDGVLKVNVKYESVSHSISLFDMADMPNQLKAFFTTTGLSLDNIDSMKLVENVVEGSINDPIPAISRRFPEIRFRLNTKDAIDYWNIYKDLQKQLIVLNSDSDRYFLLVSVMDDYQLILNELLIPLLGASDV